MINHSFAVMAYKDSPYLADCLDSLTSQTTGSQIYITTSTPSGYIDDIARKYGVQVFGTEPGLGLAHDWNFSFGIAKTKYVTLAHQDDIYEPNYTERCVSAAEKFNDTLICFTGYSELTNDRERKNTLMLNTKKLIHIFFMPFEKNIRNRFWKKASLSFGSPIPCPSVMYNKEMLANFAFSEKYKINVDWDAWLRMASLRGRFVYVPEILLKHRIHTASATTGGLKENIRQQEDLEIFNRIWPAFMAKLLSKFYSRSYTSNEA